MQKFCGSSKKSRCFDSDLPISAERSCIFLVNFGCMICNMNRTSRMAHGAPSCSNSNRQEDDTFYKKILILTFTYQLHHG